MYDNYYELQRRRGNSEDVLLIEDITHPTRVHQMVAYGLMELVPLVNIFLDKYQLRLRVRSLT